ncbi:MAG: hypothetical protein KJ749_05880, partial [Planctomycetes bacterium]|nr:hypothetical protein [Planctomycetota bacterium]
MHQYKSRIEGIISVFVVLLLVHASAAGSSWVSVAGDGTVSVADTATATAPTLSVLQHNDAGIDAALVAHGFSLVPQATKGGEFVQVSWPEAPVTGEIGSPALPVVRELFVAPPGVEIQLSVTTGDATVVNSDTAGMSLLLLPVQPPIPKLPGARESAPFIFDDAAYAVDAGLLPDRASVQELGIVRGQRLFLLEVYPVDYNPVAKTLTFWPDIAVELDFVGEPGPNAAVIPFRRLQDIVLNPQPNAPRQRLGGNYLIVVASTFESDIASFAAAKSAQGYTVSTYSVPGGTSNSAIKSYITGLWGTPDAPDYILLVGDTNTIPHWTGGGEGSPATDIQYACMDGSSDWYPDIPFGRFPARTSTQLQAMVDKTLYYENGPLADPDYLKRAVFMASTDNYQISEGTHNYVINNYLEPNGYLVDKLYTVTYGATTQDVRNSFNDGRFYGIYSGHGGTYSWADGPVFSQSDVNNLTNADMYPFVCSFACITGTYTVDECFVETWLRAPNKGAVAMYGSSVNSYWTEDDILEKRLFDSIFDAEDDVPTEVGPVWIDAQLRFLAHFGSGSTTRRYFEMYNLMGDPTLRLPSACSEAGEISLDRGGYACADTVEIAVTDCGLDLDSGVIDSVVVTVESDSESAGESITLYETDSASAQFTGSMALSTTDALGVLLVAEGDTITATYVDADDGVGGINVTVTDTATVDCSAPSISNVQTINIEARSVQVTFDADEPARGIVHYGPNCATLPWTAEGSGYALSPIVGVSGLASNMTYFYTVEAEDEAGNSVSDDNGGACYSFTTPEIPDFFTELFTGDNDLDNLTLVFTPNGSNDYYLGCVESISALPVNPAGGTSISLSDDDYETINLSGGAMVSIYGNTSSQFFVGSNGYITFVHGESGYDESLETHFGGVPRVSGLFDDLDSAQAGTVSWKQLPDRAVVTWNNVTEHNGANSNTFQIELHFGGMIVISYLNVSMTDGLAGLSAGTGLDPDFIESDLSAMGPCAPPGDCDEDGDTDEDDYAVFADCFSGNGGGVGTGCMCVNIDGDGDVDCDDWNLFGDLWTTGDPPTFAPCELPGATPL